MRLKNKVAIITGAARGMGRVFALRFAKEGAKLTVCDIHDCNPVAEEIKNLGSEALALKTDVTSEADTAAMAKKTVERFGRIDILVNNAGIFGSLEVKDFKKSVEDIKAEDWDPILNVNVKGVFLASKAVIPYMKKQKSGKIVNIASSVAFTGLPHFIHYSVSKGGVVTLTRGLAWELGDFGINVNAVAPSLVKGEASRSTYEPGFHEELIASEQKLHKGVEPEDVANAVVFMASDEADKITGQTLLVNGGGYMH
ncbi:MAG: 3-oxoacyl-ACP reductase family protein [Dehalococcoidia bacterium]|jgi:NAD(P)-dependent dehydrogenase (short-subunit alcohol dehydrogenase family)